MVNGQDTLISSQIFFLRHSCHPACMKFSTWRTTPTAQPCKLPHLAALSNRLSTLLASLSGLVITTARISESVNSPKLPNWQQRRRAWTVTACLCLVDWKLDGKRPVRSIDFGRASRISEQSQSAAMKRRRARFFLASAKIPITS
jgi:hypothetical protein